MLCFHRADVNPDSLDSQRIWQWRNDPVTRAMSVTTEEIPWDRHRAWYSQAATDPSRVLLLVFEDDSPVGMVRFDLQALADAEVSINLNPQARGRRARQACAGRCMPVGILYGSTARLHLRHDQARQPPLDSHF